MTFPYPLTPDVIRDLWRFFCATDEEAALETRIETCPGFPIHAYSPQGGGLLDTPFARAFVAWREDRAESERPLPPISTLAIDLLRHNKEPT